MKDRLKEGSVEVTRRWMGRHDLLRPPTKVEMLAFGAAALAFVSVPVLDAIGHRWASNFILNLSLVLSGAYLIDKGFNRVFGRLY